MCTAVIHVPADPSRPTRLLAVRDEDPGRAWDPLGAWWPDTHPGVVGVRDALAGGAWLAADDATRRVAVILNRGLVAMPAGQPPRSRGHIALEAVEGWEVDAAPRTNGFNLVEVTAEGARVTMWDGASVRRAALAPGIHMIAHDDVDDPETPRIASWRDSFGEPGDGADWWMPWLDQLGRTAAVGPVDDRAIVRDNRPFGYPTLSLLVCAASVSAEGVDVLYGEFDEPGVWNRVTMRPPVVPPPPVVERAERVETRKPGPFAEMPRFVCVGLRPTPLNGRWLRTFLVVERAERVETLEHQQFAGCDVSSAALRASAQRPGGAPGR